jgi:peptidoglycan/LPS O-acetylase OafA/YrhL
LFALPVADARTPANHSAVARPLHFSHLEMTQPNAIQPLLRRENSFTFLRLFFALLVVYGHAFVLGGFGEEPSALWTGRHIAGREIAVQGFFILSGFLIAKSLADSPSLWRFACHRVFRIVPALWVYLGLMVFVVAPWLMEARYPGKLSYWEQLTVGPASAWHYLWQNWAIQTGEYRIVPLFADNPHKFNVNGSLWSVHIEVTFYLFAALAVLARQIPVRTSLLLGALGAATAVAFESMNAAFLAAACLWRGVVRPGWGVPTLFGLIYVGAILNATSPGWTRSLPADSAFLLLPFHHVLWHAPALAFLGGMLCWRFRDHLRWDWRLFSIGLVLLVAGAWLRSWNLVMPLAMPYCLFYLAARLPFQRLERLGDYSYGIYIFSFPIQQLLIYWGLHHRGVGVLIAASMAASIAMGALSWFLVEKPALRLGRKLGAWRPGRQTAAAAPEAVPVG